MFITPGMVAQELLCNVNEAFLELVLALMTFSADTFIFARRNEYTNEPCLLFLEVYRPPDWFFPN